MSAPAVYSCIALVLALGAGKPLFAQSNEFTFTKGEGRFVAGPASQPSRVGSLTYSRSVNDLFAIEGGFDWFFLRGDGFSGFEIAGVYHFRPAISTRKIIPFISLGVGNTSTDLTEIPARAVYHVRTGIKYYFFKPIGIRFEFEQRVLHTSRDAFFQGAGEWASLPSVAVGISLRH